MLRTINVLASDFKGNNWYNVEVENGCPLQRAFKRAGLLREKEFYSESHILYNNNQLENPTRKVLDMFHGELPVEDFSFTIEL